MTYQWILYLLVLSALWTGCAWIGGKLVLPGGAAGSRWSWGVALLAGNAFPLAAWLFSGSDAGSPAAIQQLAPLRIDLFGDGSTTSAPAATEADAWILGLWLTMSLLVALRIVRDGLAAHRLVRSGTPLLPPDTDLVESDRGPAVVGLFRPRILLPSWTSELTDCERDLLIAHERAHVAARDPLLLVVGHLATVIQPWNPFIWLQLRQLREAIELDCDRRVLREHPADRYGRLLVAVAERRAAAPPVLATSLVRTRSQLQRRIETMLNPAKNHPAPLRAAAAVAVFLLGAAACSVDGPPTGAEEAGQRAERLTPEEKTAAIVSNPEQSPTLNNRREFSRALVDLYPSDLKQAGIGGVVEVRLLVTESGAVDEVQVVTSSGHPALDRAAVESLERSARFDPARDGGVPVSTWIQLPLTFQT